MSSGQAVSLALPDALYERIQHLAAQNNRSVEEVLLETLEVLFGAVPQEPALSALDDFSDDQLWAVVYRRLAWTERERLRDLNARAGQNTLSAAEHREREALIDQVDRQMILRSRALFLLQQRGHDVEKYLNLGA